MPGAPPVASAAALTLALQGTGVTDALRLGAPTTVLLTSDRTLETYCHSSATSRNCTLEWELALLHPSNVLIRWRFSFTETWRLSVPMD